MFFGLWEENQSAQKKPTQTQRKQIVISGYANKIWFDLILRISCYPFCNFSSLFQFRYNLLASMWHSHPRNFCFSLGLPLKLRCHLDCLNTSMLHFHIIYSKQVVTNIFLTLACFTFSFFFITGCTTSFLGLGWLCPFHSSMCLPLKTLVVS